MRLHSPVLLSLGCCLLAPAAEAQGGSAAVSQFKAEVSFHLGVLKERFSEIGDDIREDLTALVGAKLGQKINFPDFVQSLTDIALDAGNRSATAADDETRLIEQFTSGAVGSGNTPPEVLMPGACAEIEKFAKKLQGMLEKNDAATLKDLKKAIAQVEKAFDVQIHVVQTPTAPPAPPAPGPGNAPEPPPAPKPTKIDALGAGSDTTIADDGVLCVGGTADPALNGGNVSVTIVGPSGTETASAPVSVSNCRWRVCFSSLREGNYAVSAHQGGGAVISRIGVPGRPSD